MASRRLRLKAVINLPVRRGRDNGSSDVNTTKIPSPGEGLSKERDSLTDSEVLVVKSDAGNVESSSKVPPAESSNKDEKKETTEKDKDETIILEPNTASCTKSLPLSSKNVRKRLNPTVNLPVISRKPRENTSAKVEKIYSVTKPTNSDGNVPSLSGITRLSSNSSPRKDRSSTLEVSSSDKPSCSKNVDEVNKTTTDPSTASAKSFRSKLVKSKPSPRLVDSTVRRKASSVESDDINKPNVVAKSVVGPNKSNDVSRDIEIEEDTDFTISSAPGSQSCLEKPVVDSAEETVSKSIPATADSMSSAAFSEDPLETELMPNSKTEKRTAHRRLRKNGVVELLTKARRDFQTKYGNKTPDKKQLTMFDLIFYNPATNPMKITEITDDKSTITSSPCKSGDLNQERLAEESVDDVNKLESEEEENAAMPAPQVKVGPDGSLIIDEKSLVIETTGSQKRKDELANSAVVMEYGLGSTTYNSFSNKVKSKEWTNEETLKFYRALHSVGTDFLLMQSIFPKRTRKDLKMKFKKEDRLNRDLVDKALRNPLEFNLSQLEKDIEQEEKENEKKKQNELLLKESAIEQKKQKLKERKLCKKSFLAKSLDAGDTGKPRGIKNKAKNQTDTMSLTSAVVEAESIKDVPVIKGKGKRKATSLKKSSNTKAKRVKKKCVRENDDSLSSTSEEDESVVYSDDHNVVREDESNKSIVEGCVPVIQSVPSTTQKFVVPTVGPVDMSSSDDEEVFLKTTRQTRYGRIPQRRVLSSEESGSEDESNAIEEQVVSSGDESCSNTVPDPAVLLGPGVGTQLTVPDLSNVEPGSLVILSTPGQSTFQLFMVGPKDRGASEGQMTHIPVSVTQEMLEAVSNKVVEGSQPSNNT